MKMRTLLAMLIIASTALAGCSSNDDSSDDPTHCDDGHEDEHCATQTETDTETGGNTTTTTTATNTTTTPNELPQIVLKTLDFEGNETNVTMLGGNLTFDGSMSVDPDGTITDMAVIVIDSNQTRFAALIQNGAYTQVNFAFDRPGPVDVIVNAIDDRGGQISMATKVFVNHMQVLTPHKFNGAAPSQLSSADGCSGPTGQAVLDPSWWKLFTFDVKAGATYVEAMVDVSGQGADAQFALCDPEGTAISDNGAAGDVILSFEGLNFTESLDYAVSVLSQTPQTEAQPTVIVHYEPRAAAAPAEA